MTERIRPVADAPTRHTVDTALANGNDAFLEARLSDAIEAVASELEDAVRRVRAVAATPSGAHAAGTDKARQVAMILGNMTANSGLTHLISAAAERDLHISREG